MKRDRLSQELTAKLEAARMTAEALSLDAQLARDTVGRWIRGGTVPTFAALQAVENVLSERLGYSVDLAAAVKHRRSARQRTREPGLAQRGYPDLSGQEAPLLRQIASAIENALELGKEPDLAFADHDSDLNIVFQDEAYLPYVRRPQLEQQLLGMLEAKPPVVVVAGPPSSGKRTLVAAALRGLPPARVVTIDASSPEAARESMFEALRRGGMRYDQIGLMPQYPLKQLINSPDGPEYLVIENASNSQLLKFFIGKEKHVTIIVTTARRLPGVKPQYRVEVKEMRNDEAAELVCKLLPDASASDAAMLAAALDCQVLAIITACGMIKRGGSIPEFCRNLRKDMAAVFDGERSQRYPALTQIYRKTLMDLSKENPQALRALELIAYLNDSDAHSAFVVLALGKVMGIDPNNKLHLMTIAQRAVTALCDRYLISVDERSYISMPRLAKTIIAHLVHDRGPQICDELRAGILNLVSLSRAQLAGMPLKDFLNHHGLTLIHLMNTHIDPKKSGGPLDYLYVYAQGLADLLREIGEPPWRVMLVMIQTSEGFSLMAQVLPEKLNEIARPNIYIEWSDEQQQHRIEYVIKGWETRKVMQLLVVSESDELVPVDA